VRILLSLACKQDEELIQVAKITICFVVLVALCELQIVQSFGEAESICDATHFVANQVGVFAERE
jgi:phosphoheptose isomerase